jgi:cyclophilin family peptidyl-prolyl cis-trans isomerase
MRAYYRTAILAVAAIGFLSGCGGSSNSGTAVPSSVTSGSTAASLPPPISRTAPASAECSYQASPGDPAPSGKDVGLPPKTANVSATSAVLKTNNGDITITLAAAAPCTVRSFAHLVTNKYYDGTPCHRLTSHESLKVLQCGDPTGTGTGGPGYTVPDENPTDLPPAGQASLYARGTVAMANTGQPNSGGSQFFLVYGDSTLPPNYAVFGKVDATGLATLDKIAAAGLTPGERGPNDGSPKNPVTIEQAAVGS